jgi:hypothetical protein
MFPVKKTLISKLELSGAGFGTSLICPFIEAAMQTKNRNKMTTFRQFLDFFIYALAIGLKKFMYHTASKLVN